jgi:hypothetical protein
MNRSKLDSITLYRIRCSFLWKDDGRSSAIWQAEQVTAKEKKRKEMEAEQMIRRSIPYSL